MNDAEWEALCDGCGKCCLHKLLDEAPPPADEASTGLYMQADEEVYYTDIRCRYLDPDTARCGCYSKRLEKVAECVNITLADLPQIHFMPSTCAYRRLHEGVGLAEWHPLLHGGSKVPMQQAGIGVPAHNTISETQIDEDDYELRIVTWPL
ncbi:MAG: YcgN family cysteine cluster protein [Idiomarina sp.]|nr:YcgN family cysteine cluster protein [Idiomarina sp.]